MCPHGLADGAEIELTARVRRVFAPQGAFRPFAALGLGVGVARYAGDDVAGLIVPIHAGGGVRATVAPQVAIVVEGALALGVGAFGRGLGAQPQLGFAITAGAELRLR